MSESISRRTAVFGAGALGLSATGVAGSRSAPSHAGAAAGQDPAPAAATDAFSTVWPDKLWEPNDPPPKCGYPWAARLIYSLAGEWKALNAALPDRYPNERRAVKKWIKQMVEGYSVPATVAIDMPDGEAAEVFRGLWRTEPDPYSHSSKKARSIGFQPRAVMSAFTSSAEELAPNYGWQRQCAVVEGDAQKAALVQQQQPEEGQPPPTLERQNVTPPQEEEVKELVDELP